MAAYNYCAFSDLCVDTNLITKSSGQHCTGCVERRTLDRCTKLREIAVTDKEQKLK